MKKRKLTRLSSSKKTQRNNQQQQSEVEPKTNNLPISGFEVSMVELVILLKCYNREPFFLIVFCFQFQ